MLIVWFVGFRDGVVISIFSLTGTVVSAEGVEKMPKRKTKQSHISKSRIDLNRKERNEQIERARPHCWERC